MTEADWTIAHERIRYQTEQIMEAILDDVTGRRGWRQEYEQFEPEIQEEIEEKWSQLIKDILYEDVIKPV